MRRMLALVSLLVAGIVGLAEPSAAQRAAERAQRALPDNEAAIAERMNANAVAVISGTPGGTYFRAASDMAFVLDDGDNLRILPVLRKGAGKNAYDIRFLRGIDLGFVRTDTLDFLRQDKRLNKIDQHLVSIARLFNDELHVIAPREVTDIRQLAGRKVRVRQNISHARNRHLWLNLKNSFPAPACFVSPACSL